MLLFKGKRWQFWKGLIGIPSVEREREDENATQLCDTWWKKYEDEFLKGFYNQLIYGLEAYRVTNIGDKDFTIECINNLNDNNNKPTMSTKVNKDLWMIIRNTDTDLKEAFIRKAEGLGLEISHDIEDCEEGHAVSMGTSEKYHINWARRIDYYADRGVVPVYDIAHDWAKITKRLTDYALWLKDNDGEDLTEGGQYKVDSDEGEVTLSDDDYDDVVLTKDEVRQISSLLNSGLRVTIDDEDNTVSINNGDYVLSGDEIDAILEKLED